jgi:mono/diheme cytochrome c family protein
MFAGEAYNVEMGVTNEAFPNERNTTSGCATNPTPEDTTNFSDPTPSGSPASDFSSDITNFAMFMRLLAAPTPATSTTPPTASSTSSTQVAAATSTSAIAAAASSTTSSSTATSAASVTLGRQVFSNIGCAACHIASQTTTASTLDPTFSNKSIQPFSDFAVHTMGTGLADNVSQGNASGTQFRTAPLWGVGQRLYFLHDGRTNNLVTAITQHASSGSEANQVIQNWNQLSRTNQQALMNFLRSL